MKDETMMARIRDAEHAQAVAELTQKISRLEMKVKENGFSQSMNLLYKHIDLQTF